MNFIRTAEGLTWTTDSSKLRYDFNGDLHCTTGPAIEHSEDRSKFWYVRGRLHREDGPARELSDGTKQYFLFGERIPKRKYTKKLIRQLKMIRIIET